MKKQKAPTPRWYIVSAFVVSVLTLLTTFLYLLKFNGTIHLVLGVIGLLLAFGFAVLNIVYIIVATKRSYDTKGIGLAITSLVVFIVSIVLIFALPDSNFVTFVGNVSPIIPLIYSIVLLVGSPRKKEQKYSNHISIPKLVTLHVITFGLYRIGWFFKNWSDIENDTRHEASTWSYLGLFIPIANFFVVYSQFDTIKEIAKEKNIKTTWSAGWQMFWIIMLGTAVGRAYDLTTAGLALAVLFLVLSLIPTMTVQDTLNEIWDATQAKLPKRQSLTKGEVAWCIVGVILWLLLLKAVL